MRRAPFWFLRRRRAQLQSDVDEELDIHLRWRVEELVRRGMPVDAAMREARRQFGDLEYTRQYCRKQGTRKETVMRWRLWADELRQDVRTGLRQCVRSPGLTAVVVLTLALGTGANTALFSIFNSLVLRPLPVRHPEQLALLLNGSWSYPIFQQIKEQESALFDGTLAWSRQRFDLSPSGQTEIVDGAYVSGTFFDVLGVSAARGRLLTQADDESQPDGPVAVISHRLWRQRYGSDVGVVGRQLHVRRIPFTIVGVMPAGFFGPDVGRNVDVMLPFAAEPSIDGNESRLNSATSRWLQIMVRLPPGHAADNATAAIRQVQPPIVQPWTKNAPPLTFASAETGSSPLRRRFERPLWAMVVAVGLVMLVACGNIASLMLSRTLARRRELSVRMALGSSRWRIVRLLFVETALLAAAGATLGLVFAGWGGALLVDRMSTVQAAASLDLSLDWRVLAFTTAVGCLSALIAGMAPALGLQRVGTDDVRTDAGRAMVGDHRSFVRGALVVCQIAVSFTLVVGAGLFLRTFTTLHRLPLGFTPDPLIVMELQLQGVGGGPQERAARVERLRDAVAAVPGARSVAVSSTELLGGMQTGWSTGRVGIADGPVGRVRESLWLNATSPGWFDTMGIPLRLGRDFVEADRVGRPPVAIVNETFVRQNFPGQNPIGQRVGLGIDLATGALAKGGEPRHEIVGVVADAVYTTPREGMLPVMFTPIAQRQPASYWSSVQLTINATPGQRAVVERRVADALVRVDPSVAFVSRTFDDVVAATAAQERFVAQLSAFFGGLALLLAAVGLYGLIAHSVRARQKEIGLRIALGAVPGRIVGLMVRRVSMLTAMGLGLGVAGSLWATGFVETLLFKLDSRDPLTFAGAAIVLVAVGAVAAWVPARRASRIDPLASLRD